MMKSHSNQVIICLIIGRPSLASAALITSGAMEIELKFRIPSKRQSIVLAAIGEGDATMRNIHESIKEYISDITYINILIGRLKRKWLVDIRRNKGNATTYSRTTIGSIYALAWVKSLEFGLEWEIPSEQQSYVLAETDSDGKVLDIIHQSISWYISDRKYVNILLGRLCRKGLIYTFKDNLINESGKRRAITNYRHTPIGELYSTAWMESVKFELGWENDEDNNGVQDQASSETKPSGEV